MDVVTSHTRRLLFPPHCVLCQCVLESPQEMLSDRSDAVGITDLDRIALDSKGAFPSQCCSDENHVPSHEKDFIYPQTMLCDHCKEVLVLEQWPGCGRCGAYMPGVYPPPRSCFLCEGQPIYFDSVIPLGVYENDLRRAVLLMKKRSYVKLTETLGNVLYDARERTLNTYNAELVVAVPMHWRRQLIRGVNNPDILAQVLGKRLGVPSEPFLFSRRRFTPMQRTVSAWERFRNVRDAFLLNEKRMKQYHGVKNVLLVDDILTTGATCSELARILKRKMRVKNVYVACIARAQGKR